MRALRRIGRVWLGVWLFLAFATFPLALYSPGLLRLMARGVGIDVGRDAAFLLGFPALATVGVLGWLPLELASPRHARRAGASSSRG